MISCAPFNPVISKSPVDTAAPPPSLTVVALRAAFHNARGRACFNDDTDQATNMIAVAQRRHIVYGNVSQCVVAALARRVGLMKVETRSFGAITTSTRQRTRTQR
jgi:hypothetical protein